MTDITPEEQDRFDREVEIADDTFCALMDDMGSVVEEEDVDPVVMMYALWVTITHFLFECGWNSADLARDVTTHERIHYGQNNPS